MVSKLLAEYIRSSFEGFPRSSFAAAVFYVSVLLIISALVSDRALADV